MTGSPVTKNPLDLFSQCYFLDPFHLNHESYYSFRMRYAIMKTANIAGRKIQLVSGFRNLGELSEKLRPFSYRVLKEDCLDLPDKIFMKRNIKLSPDQLKVYDQMKKEALAILNGKKVTTVNALTQLNCQSLDPKMVDDTLGTLLKYQDDIEAIRGDKLADILSSISSISSISSKRI